VNKFIPLLLFFFFITNSIAAAFNPVSASVPVEDSWNTKTPMNQARWGLEAVTVDGKIYAIGGQTDNHGSFVGTNERYDPKKDTWFTLKSMPTSRSNFGIAEYQGKIYCIGGYTGNVLDVNEVYDIATNKWSTKTALPVSESNVQAHVVDEKIFVIASRLLYMYDPVTDSWTQKASLPKTIFQSDPYVYSAAVDNQIIVITSDEHLEVLIYNPKTDVWSEGKTTGYQSGFGNAIAVATSGHFAPQRIYMVCGGPGIFFMPISFVMAYDPLNGTWEQIKNYPTPRARFGVAVLNDVLYVIGGALLGTEGNPEASPVNEQYVPISYNGTLPSATASTAPIIATLAIITGTIAIGTFFYFKKKEKTGFRL
jgi:N-acetylneuraminic acid mutarotase